MRMNSAIGGREEHAWLPRAVLKRLKKAFAGIDR